VSGSGQIRVGIGGWTYPPWRGSFYPPALPQSGELQFAAAALGAIEINATFYGRQSASSWEKWASAVPDGFQFAVKGSRFCVTRPKLADAGEGVRNFLDQGLQALGHKLGPILWMFAARRVFDREDVARFLDLLPTSLNGLKLRHALEPRHETFNNEQFEQLARDHGVAVVFGDDDEFPCIDMDTADFRYERLQRMHEDCPTGYAPGALEQFATRTQAHAYAGQDAYVFMINGAKIRAPQAALALQDLLRIAPS
jgi:uncharacterized protein YecE (DUF72 family)